jgi:hypothetical protein
MLTYVVRFFTDARQISYLHIAVPNGYIMGEGVLLREMFLDDRLEYRQFFPGYFICLPVYFSTYILDAA